MALKLTFVLAAALVTATLNTPLETRADDNDVVSTKRNLHVYKGNTALGTSPSGRKFRVYFGEDGTVSYRDSKGLTQKGRWSITDDGLMCYDWRRWRDRCYAHRKDGDGYQSYREGKTIGSRFRIVPGKAALPK